jgi:hypothetical protein
VNSKNFTKASRSPFTEAREQAQALAQDILLHLAGDHEEMGRFLTETGFDPVDLRRATQEQGFAGLMLDYLCSHEALLLAYAGTCGRDPAAIDTLRLRLAGHP